jgi:hypothetical protein
MKPNPNDGKISTTVANANAHVARRSTEFVRLGSSAVITDTRLRRPPDGSRGA